LQRALQLDASHIIAFWKSCSRDGITFGLGKYVLVGPATDCSLARMQSIMSVDGKIFVSMQIMIDKPEVDIHGGLHATLRSGARSCALMSLIDAPITALWDVPDCYVPGKVHFTVRF
jgi:hypothetical protein